MVLQCVCEESEADKESGGMCVFLEAPTEHPVSLFLPASGCIRCWAQDLPPLSSEWWVKFFSRHITLTPASAFGFHGKDSYAFPGPLEITQLNLLFLRSAHEQVLFYPPP